jgi:Peptidase A4 family
MLRVMSEPPAPRETSKKIPALLLTVLLVVVLSFAFVVFFLHLSSLSRQMSSLNWSGYSVVSNFDNPQPQFTRVNASWAVPTVNVSINNSFSAEWIGVGGQFDNTLIQAGTRQDSIDGQVAYSAWYELVPGKLVNINSLSISPADRITASISLVDADAYTWTIEIHDDTNGQSFSKSVVHFSSALSVEWIEERPSLDDSPQTLADFGQVTFTGCGAALNGKDGTIGSFPSNRITMYNGQNKPLVKVSDLTREDSSFTISFLG